MKIILGKIRESLFLVKVEKLRLISLFLIIFQGIGIRFFSGQGVLLALMIIALNYKGLIHFSKRALLVFTTSVALILIIKLFNPSFTWSKILYLIAVFFSVTLFLISYKDNPKQLSLDFFTVLHLLISHALIGFILSILFPWLFYKFNVMNQTFFYLFYVSDSHFWMFYRNTGLFWEPGVFQIVANFYLFLCIKRRESIKKIFFGVLAVVSSFSTAGLFILALNLVYFFIIEMKRRKVFIMPIVIAVPVFLLLSPIIIDNISEKVDGNNTSGLARLRDLLVGVELIKEKPILGHGVFELDYLRTKSYAFIIEQDIFTTEYLQQSEEMSGGFTNGFLGIFAFFGIPMGIVVLLSVFQNKLIFDCIWTEKTLFSLILLVSMISEPITPTCFFLLFPFSHWAIKK
ncbi:MAG: O-antigen ligase family protein [Breznakibacter sp.]